MSEEEKKKLQDDLAAATQTIADLKKTIAEKDAVIDAKNNDIVLQRKNYKKLSEMSEAEKAAMSEKERELQERAEALEKSQQEFMAQQEAFKQKEVEARRERAVVRIAGKDPELQQKVRENMTKIVDFDKAQTDEEVAALATSAFNMLGVPKPDAVSQAMNTNYGEAPGDSSGQSYADTTAGKSLAESMGLAVAQPDPGNGGGQA